MCIDLKALYIFKGCNDIFYKRVEFVCRVIKTVDDSRNSFCFVDCFNYARLPIIPLIMSVLTVSVPLEILSVRGITAENVFRLLNDEGYYL